MDTPTTATDSTGSDPKKKKVTPAGKYKAMVAPADTTQQPLMVEKADGTIGQWGNDPNAPKKKVVQTKPQLNLSDKAKGYSNSYYSPN